MALGDTDGSGGFGTGGYGSDTGGLGNGFGAGIGSSMGYSGSGNSGYGYGGGSGSFSNPFSDSFSQPTTSYGEDSSSLGSAFDGLNYGYSGNVDFSNPATSFSPGMDVGSQEQSFFDSPFGKFLKSAGLMAANMTPVGRLATLGYNAYNGLQSGNYGQVAGGLVGAATGNGLLGTAVGLGTDAAMGKDVTQQAARAGVGTLGSIVGNGIAGPVGGFVGGQLGAMAAGYNGTTGPAPERSQYGGGDVMSTLAGLYAANRNAKAAQGQTLNLQSMFGPNSAYAQQMRQQLERRDAAAGRRSQYGPREVELQAALAKTMASAAPGIQNQNLQASQAAQAQRNAQLNLLLQAGKQTGLFDYAQKGLSSMFAPQQAPQTSYGITDELGNAFGAGIGSSMGYDYGNLWE